MTPPRALLCLIVGDLPVAQASCQDFQLMLDTALASFL